MTSYKRMDRSVQYALLVSILCTAWMFLRCQYDVQQAWMIWSCMLRCVSIKTPRLQADRRTGQALRSSYVKPTHGRSRLMIWRITNLLFSLTELMCHHPGFWFLEQYLFPQVPRMLVTWAIAVHRPIVVEYLYIYDTRPMDSNRSSD